ncbi:MAG: acyltransferase [Rhodocyclaceae bacterium]|nr:acyltransferase [Rhodocyclaceae bacterium]
MAQHVINPACPEANLPLAEATPDAHARFMTQRRFGSLDGLRALSIVAVIWHHTAPSWASSALVDAGTQGVTLFFAISGFLITTLMLRERERSGRIDLPAFYARRSLRIFPLYYLTVLLYVVLVYAVERHSAAGQGFFNNLPYFATYTSNIFVPLDGRVIFYFAWSLAAEEQFYLLWPLLLCLCRSGRQAAALLGLAIVLCIVGHALQNRFLSAVPLAILVGALFAIGMHERRSYEWLNRLFGSNAALAGIVALLALSLGSEQPFHFANALLCAGLVACCVIREDHLLAGALSLRPLAYVGSISYGMYLLHMLSKSLVVKLLGLAHLPLEGVHVFALTTLAAIAAATLSFRYFESIFLGLKLRYAR